MKSRWIIPLVVAFALAHTARAQHIHFKFGGGLSSHYGDARCVGAFKAGVGVEWELGQRWAFSPGLEIYGKGWQDPNQTVYVFDEAGNPMYDEAGNPLTGVKNRSATQNYIELPLLFSYFLRTGESRYVVFSAGPYLAYGVTGKQKTKGDTDKEGGERFFYEKNTFDEPGTKRFDTGIQAFVGYQFANGVTLGLEGDFGLTKFNAAGDRNISGLVSIGYKLK